MTDDTSTGEREYFRSPNRFRRFMCWLGLHCPIWYTPMREYVCSDCGKVYYDS